MNGKIKDPGSAVTHFIGMFLACAAMLPLLAKASTHADRRYPACMAIFMVCMVTLYAASTIYHTFDISRKVNRILQKLDHSAISLLIAGSYTPVCLLELEQPTGKRLCILVWLIALVSIVIKLYRHGLGLCPCAVDHLPGSERRGLRLASRGRTDLYGGGYHLRPEAADFQCPA